MAKKNLVPKSQDMSRWYTDVIQLSKLADYSPVKGCMVMRPSGYGIWENIQKNLDPMLKELGVENAYFPLFIPLSLLNKEAEHVEGFAPELAIVTHGGGEELEEKLAIRPTSETIMYSMYSKWIQSHRDLPLMLNQWNNVVRWEKRTYFFLRTTEFLWQEAHTAHATHDEAKMMVMAGLSAYRALVEDYLAIPVIKGKKSESEKFAGADLTTTAEAMMPDGKALQVGTSHDLGQNFSKESAFNIAFQNKIGLTDYVWQTSYGLSTRTIGALIMVHGDDEGLVLPPKIAPYQVAIVPTDDKGEVMSVSNKLLGDLKKSGVRAKIIFDSEHSLGFRLNESEIQGIPLSLIVGEKEISSGVISGKIRHNQEKVTFQFGRGTEKISELLETIQKDMFDKASAVRESLTSMVNDYDEFKNVMNDKRGFIRAYWCEDSECEKTIKEETKASTRCLPFIDENGNVLEESGNCVKCGKPATHRWIFAQAY